MATPLPIDPLYDADAAIAGSARDTALGVGGAPGTVRAARTGGLLDFGFTESGYDPENPASKPTYAFDPNNPWSKAALLKSSYDTSRKRTGQGMASGGQLYSGSYQNAQDAINRQQLGSEDSLQKSLTAFLSGNTGDYTKAKASYTNAMTAADANRLMRAADPANPFYTPTPGPAAGVGSSAVNANGTPIKGLGPQVPLSGWVTAGPGIKGTKTTTKKTPKGKVVTYSNKVKGP